jgi:hypothetical protein
MKRKHWFLAIAALLAAGGLWLARSGRPLDNIASGESSTGAAVERASAQPGETLNSSNRVQMHAPPDQTRKFREFTPEQRVEFARKGHGPGG